MLVGHGAHQPLEHDGLVGGLQRIGAVLQHHLHLARRIFRDQRAGGQSLRIARCIEVFEERCEIIKVIQQIGLEMFRPCLVHQCARRARCAGERRRPVKQVELQLDGCDWREVQLFKTFDDALQYVARLGDGAAAVHLAHRGDELGRRAALDPRDRLQRAGHGPDNAVGVTIFPDKAGFLDVPAGHVEAQDGARHEAAVAVGGHQLFAAQMLAALGAAQVGEDELEGLRLRVGSQKGFRLGDGFGKRVGRHGVVFSGLRQQSRVLSGSCRARRAVR